MSKHNIVLPTASLGVSCTVRNEAALDPRQFHRSPLFIFAATHISSNIWALLSLFRKPDTVKQKNAFPPNFIHSLDSTHMMMTALGCHRYRCCKCLFISVLSWISAPKLFSCLPSLLFFTVPAWRTFLCTTASGRTLSLWTPWTRYYFPVWPWFIPAQFVLARVAQHAWVILKPSDPASNSSFKVPVELKLLCRLVQIEVMILWWKKHFLLMHPQVARLRWYMLSWINECRLFSQAAQNQTQLGINGAN